MRPGQPSNRGLEEELEEQHIVLLVEEGTDSFPGPIGPLETQSHSVEEDADRTP